MTLVKFNQPAFPSLVNRFFNDDFFKTYNGVATKDEFHSLPAVNVKEVEGAFQIELAAPGLKKEDFKISVHENRLSISVKKESSNEETTEKYSRKEFSYSSFQRSFMLPKTVDGEKIEASYTDGILNITLPKKEEAKVQPREISIA
ncbi:MULTISPECIES: Hsp20/alpha crystallin family protein [unclassified Siphonobacter]|uniref:Hsp20/alpha crystallin family protein n=1 Tax=unclassified Siphonobacter TaxID=2635712 RepID=UPI000CB1E16E|nr:MULTISPECIES: Hsp20/alpha crystallin family protein [unclassified Siphonobacter]MDQ1087582.1 HSP20 family protein [Siphonobacter sp. SORGH_AS_1065]PKK37916.1 heat-shock protein Hsp20 [Siphonobacter sp. SORGH_AS_0500]